ncbi:MAG: hypothetical protein IKH78_10220 [Ruminococcus sp.]|nr:hypothetical protein [Ruminococcus sp.]
MKKLTIIPFLAALALTGCGSVTPAATVPTETTTAEATTEPVTEPKHMKLIGVKASGSSVYIVTLENKTGKDITAFTVKGSSQQDYPANMLEEGDPFVKDEKRQLYYVPLNTDLSTYGDSDALTSEEFTILIEFSDKKVAVLHQFPFGDIDSGTILMSKDTAYIEYMSKSANKKVSTKEAEEMIETTEPSTEATTAKRTESNNYTEPVYTQPQTQAPVYTQAPTTVYVEPTTVYVEPTNPPETQAQEPATGCGGQFATFPSNPE